MTTSTHLRSRTDLAPIHGRLEGSQLLELMLALTVLVVGSMGFLFATQANFKASRDVSTYDLVSSAFSTAMETLEDADFSTLYATFNNTFIDPPTVPYTTSGPSVGELLDAGGSPARVFVSFDVNETSLPASYGPVIDLDGDGALTTTDISSEYDLLPTRLTLTYRTVGGMTSQSVFLILGSRT